MKTPKDDRENMCQFANPKTHRKKDLDGDKRQRKAGKKWNSRAKNLRKRQKKNDSYKRIHERRTHNKKK